MIAPRTQCQPDSEYDNWLLHRQPADQIADHKFSIWSGEHPVVLANEAVGEDGVLAHIVSELNSVAALKSRVEEQDRLLAEAADFLNRASRMDAMDLGAKITAYRLKQQRSVAMPLEDRS